MRRIHGSVVHIDVRGDRCGSNTTAPATTSPSGSWPRAVPQERIVLGFHAPYKRPLTDFATG